MATDTTPASSSACDWLEALLEEYEEDVKTEARWPTLLLQSSGRKVVWSFCDVLGVNTKGVAGSACRLLERYLSRHIRTFLQESRATTNLTTDSEEWERYKDVLASRFHLVMASCIQLAAKMTDLLAPLSATMMRATLFREGLVHTKAEIVDMEYHVYSTLDFRIPLWTTLEISEFLATQVGLEEPSMLEAVGLIINLAEFHRDQLELHMRCWSDACNTPGSTSSSSGKASLHNLHVCAGVVAATVQYMRSPIPEPSERLATITRTSYSFMKALCDTILKHIIPGQKHISILKKRRLR